MYGEGGNHILHCMRRNPDIVHLVHNNMVYGLTKGQASPTSMAGFATPAQPEGVIVNPLNPIALAVAMDASFVARAFAGDVEHLAGIIQQAVQHTGYALVDILQPCVSFNDVNTYKWFKEHSYLLKDHDPRDRRAAFALAVQEKMALGVIYTNERKTFGKQQAAYAGNDAPLYARELNRDKLKALINSFVL